MSRSHTLGISRRRHGCTRLKRLKVLDIGGGSGEWLQKFIQWGARPENLKGIDLIAERVTQAQKLLPPTVTLRAASAAKLDANDSFDVIIRSLAPSLIADAVRHVTLGAAARKPSSQPGIRHLFLRTDGHEMTQRTIAKRFTWKMWQPSSIARSGRHHYSPAYVELAALLA